MKGYRGQENSIGSFLERNWWWILIVVVILLSQTPKVFLGAGEPCSINEDCMSNRCIKEKCDLSRIGEPCNNRQDCEKGICKNSKCELSSITGECFRNEDCAEGVCHKNKCKTEWFVKVCDFSSSLIPYKFIWLVMSIITGFFAYTRRGVNDYIYLRRGENHLRVKGSFAIFIIFMLLTILSYIIC